MNKLQPRVVPARGFFVCQKSIAPGSFHQMADLIIQLDKSDIKGDGDEFRGTATVAACNR